MAPVPAEPDTTSPSDQPSPLMQQLHQQMATVDALLAASRQRIQEDQK